MTMRRETRNFLLGTVGIGSKYPVTIQSMCNTRTADADATLAQINELAAAGCDIIRVSADSEADCGQTNPIFGGMIVSTYNSKLSPLVYAEPQISRIESMISSLYSEDGNNGVDIKKVKEWIGDIVSHRDPTAAITDGEIKNGDGATLVGSNYVG